MRAKGSGGKKKRTARECDFFLGKGGGTWLFPFPKRLEEYGNRYLHNQRKYVQRSQQSQGVEDAERQLCQPITTEISENNKRWNRSNSQGWLNLMPHCPPPLELWFQLPQLESWMAKFRKNQLIKLIYRAEALSSYMLLGQGQRRNKTQNIKLKEEEVEQKMSPQPTKVRTSFPARSGNRRYWAAALSGRYYWEIWKQQEMKSIK